MSDTQTTLLINLCNERTALRESVDTLTTRVQERDACIIEQHARYEDKVRECARYKDIVDMYDSDWVEAYALTTKLQEICKAY